jgi:hypothetical protein
MDDDEVYVTVTKEVLWKDGNGGAGAWITSGSAHPMTRAEAEAFVAAHPDVGAAVEDAQAHHDKSRAAAAAEAK